VRQSRYRPWIPVGGVIAVVIGALLWWHLWRDPGLYVTARLHDGRLIVNWSSCWLRQQTATRFASLSRVEGKSRSGCAIVYCGVDCDAAGAFTPIEGKWDFPTVPSGYKLEGTCPDIVEETVYQAEVGGRYGGTFVFRVTSNKAIEELERRCN